MGSELINIKGTTPKGVAQSMYYSTLGDLEYLISGITFWKSQHETICVAAKKMALNQIDGMIRVAASMDTYPPGMPLLKSSKEYLKQVEKEIQYINPLTAAPMEPNKFKVGDQVIGINYPDNIPAEVIEIVETEGDFPLVHIKYSHFGGQSTVTIPEYRLKHLESCSAGGIHNPAMNGVCLKCGEKS